MSAQLLARLHHGTATAAELCALTGLSQPTLARRLMALRPQVLPMGAARARRYGLLQPIRDLGAALPVYRVSPSGSAQAIGSLYALAAGEFWFESSPDNPTASRHYPGLPWWLDDLRPQGFLGRLWPHSYPELNLPQDVRSWDNRTVLYALAQRGDALWGDLIVGDTAYARWWAQQRNPATPLSAASAERYAALAQQVMQGQVAGSSAAGEQPKFLLRSLASDGQAAEAIVKFSPSDSSPLAERWADLLLAEHHALCTLRQHGLAAVHSRILRAEGRTFLHTERFDRIGPAGRLGVVSIGAADAEFTGHGGAWPLVAQALVQQHRLSIDDAECIQHIAAFGQLIGNTDMHPGNLALLHDSPSRPGYGQFALAPVYDMLPMHYAPIAGEVRTPPFIPPAPTGGLIAAYTAMQAPAVQFWQTVAADPRISPAFKTLAGENAQQVAAL